MNMNIKRTETELADMVLDMMDNPECVEANTALQILEDHYCSLYCEIDDGCFGLTYLFFHTESGRCYLGFILQARYLFSRIS